MEFYRIWRILVARRALLIVLPLVAALVGLGVTYVRPEQYESTALVLVRPGEAFKFNASAPDRKEILDFPVSQSAPIDAPSKTYIEVIKSRAVAVKIVEALQLHIKAPVQPEGFLGQLKEDIKDWAKSAIETIQNYAKYGRDIEIPPFDQAVESLEKKLLVSVRKDTYAFDITARASDPKEAAAIANMAAEIFLEHSADAYRSESARARGFIEAQLADSRKQLEKARADLLAYKSSGATFELASEYTEKLKGVSDLENTLAKIDGKLAGLRHTYSKDSPTVIAQEAERAELKEQIRLGRAQLSAFPEKERRLNALVLNEKLARESYEFFLKRYEEARVKESSVSNEIRVVSRAEPGLYPTKPLKYIYVGLGFAVALVLAIGWVLFTEPLDPRVRTIHDLQNEFEVPVLGSVPKLKQLTKVG
ncbi:MAG: GumC family protein [Brevundimonas sp.]